MEDVGIFYGHLVHFTVFCYILLTFGIVRSNLVYFHVLVFCTKKNLATLTLCRFEEERRTELNRQKQTSFDLHLYIDNAGRERALLMRGVEPSTHFALDNLYIC
jgi:hypothetical protein